jgi:hypothetical protein
VGAMAKTVNISVAIDIDESCPRCEAAAVRVVEYGLSELEFAAAGSAVDAHADDFAVALEPSPIFDCRECGFAWGELVRERMS